MIDTIFLTFEYGTFQVIEHHKFHPNANVVLSGYSDFPIIKAIQNPTGEETKQGIYKPKLTLSRSYGDIRFTAEFSIPKLMFGNNFEEVTGKDFPAVIAKLSKVLLDMGVEVNADDVKNAKVRMVHYGKNFILTDVVNASAVNIINLIAKTDTTFRTDIAEREYKNGGHLVRFYNKSQEIIFYDKLQDLRKGINISKSRSEEVDAELQRQFLAEYGKHEILRMEVRLSKPYKIRTVVKKHTEKVLEAITFADVYDESLAKKVMSAYLQEIKTMLYTVIASHKDNLMQIFLAEGISPLKSMAYAKAFELIKEYGKRSFRTMFPSINNQIDKLLKGNIGSILESESHNQIFLLHAFKRLEDVVHHFKAVRLENGENIQGHAKLAESNSDDFEYLPTKEDKKYKNMKIIIETEEEKTKDELLMEALDEDEDDEDTTV